MSSSLEQFVSGMTGPAPQASMLGASGPAHPKYLATTLDPRRPAALDTPALPHPITANGTASVQSVSQMPPTASPNTFTTNPRFTAEEKGKGRAVEPLLARVAETPSVRTVDVPKYETTKRVQALPAAIHGQANGTAAVDAGRRGQRVRKKRRLSAAGEIDPNDVDDNGTVLKKARRRSTVDSTGVPLLPLTADDRAYFSRIHVNSARPPLSDMRGPCPVWANTRQALQAAAEYLRQPVKTVGGCVQIGVGGVARGVILEGETPGQGTFWGRGSQAGTIMISLGKSRPRRSRNDAKSYRTPWSAEPQWSTAGARAAALSPPINVLPSVVHLRDSASHDSQTDHQIVLSAIKDTTDPEAHEESREIAALLMAQRARTPVAVAIAQDCSSLPFKAPRPFVVLGWFWVTDAWVEPDLPGLQLFTRTENRPTSTLELVQWKFRFDWCDGKQGVPWWSSAAEPVRDPPAPIVQCAPREHYEGEQPSLAWEVAGPSLYGSTTYEILADGVSDAHRPKTKERPCEHFCTQCEGWSYRVYAQGDLCLSDNCPWYFGDESLSDQNRIGPPNNMPYPLRPRLQVKPEHLGLTLRPPEPSGDDHSVNAGQIGRDLWRGWVCKKCGMANERTRWQGWLCEACGYRLSLPRQTFHPSQLRDPIRSVCIGPRQDDGYPSFPVPLPRSWTLFEDDIKVVQHQVAMDDGREGAEVLHALSTESPRADTNAKAVFRQLQASGPGEVPFRRHYLPSESHRRELRDLAPHLADREHLAAEKCYSPYYTIICGEEPDDLIPPIGRAISWRMAPKVCVDAMDLINERCGRFWPGLMELNSLIIAAVPPGLPAFLQMRIPIEPQTHTALLFLGSDGLVKIRPGTGSSWKSKQGEVKTQHGDVLGFKAGDWSAEISPALEGFGFVCIARRVLKRSGGLEKDHEASEDIGSKATRQRPTPARQAQKSTRPSQASLTHWYIGPRPLDWKQPLRVHPALRDNPRKAGSPITMTTQPRLAGSRNHSPLVNGALRSEQKDGEVITTPGPPPLEWTNIEIIPLPLSGPSLRAPPPASPRGKKKKVSRLDDLGLPTGRKKPGPKSRKEREAQAALTLGIGSIGTPRRTSKDVSVDGTIRSTPIKVEINADGDLPIVATLIGGDPPVKKKEKKKRNSETGKGGRKNTIHAAGEVV